MIDNIEIKWHDADTDNYCYRKETELFGVKYHCALLLTEEYSSHIKKSIFYSVEKNTWSEFYKSVENNKDEDTIVKQHFTDNFCGKYTRDLK